MDTQDPYSSSDAYDPTSGVGSTDTVEIPVVNTGRTGKGRSGSSAGTGSDSPVQDVVQQAQDTAGQVMDQAQEAAGKVVDQVRETASSQLSTQKDRAAETVGTVAQVIRSAGESLKGQNQSGIAQYADQAAERVEQFSSYLQNRDVRDIVVEVQHFARRQPTLFLAGAFLLGALGARFLKSSGQQAQQDQQGSCSGGYSSEGRYSAAGTYSSSSSSGGSGYGSSYGSDYDASTASSGYSQAQGLSDLYSGQEGLDTGYSTASNLGGEPTLMEGADRLGERGYKASDTEG